ncbi:MAG TPA: 30S ribosomal protein S9 [Candidatus Bathyarchaeia archaeon]|nr:30S ribosomal protein S9 [Candidatus Bathyarchaeia archaeon]
MPTKKPTKKESKTPEPAAKTTAAEKYLQGIGRRKLSVARAKIFVSSEKKEAKGEPEILVNGKPYKTYFCLAELREIVMSPLKTVSADGISKISVAVRGGGIRGQAESARLGIARALVLKDQEFKKTLKDLGYLTRDARMVERKKAGLKKARRAPQFSKR